MRSLLMLLVTLIVVVAACLSSGLAQQAPNRANQGGAVKPIPPSVAPPEGWKRCPRCQNNQDRKDAWAKYDVDHHAFNAHDISGVWGYDGVPFGRGQAPLLTEWAKQ